MSFNDEIKRFKKVSGQMSVELEKQWYIMNGIAVIVLWENFGWRKKKIVNFACYAGDTWSDLRNDLEMISMMEICEKETGVEVSLYGEESWHDEEFLNHDLFRPESMTIPKQTRMKEVQIKWLAAMLESSFITALHRKEKWGFGKLSEFAQHVYEHMRERRDPEYYKVFCKQNYDIELYMT